MRVNRKNDLSLKLFEVFGAVIVHQTTVDAAIELGISQPAVSIAIKKLEKQEMDIKIQKSGLMISLMVLEKVHLTQNRDLGAVGLKQKKKTVSQLSTKQSL